MLDDAKLEFWGEMQKTLFVENSAVFLAGTDLRGVVSEDGRKVHKPIISKPRSGDYTPYTDIDFQRKSASKQTLEVNTFSYAADEIDITDSMQSPYPYTEDSAKSMMNIHNTRIEQEFLSNISSAKHEIDAGVIDPTVIFDVFEEAESKLGSFDVPMQTDLRAAVFGPHTTATMRKAKAQREAPLGDNVLANGLVGPWNGWTVVQNNNLPWSGTLTVDTNPTDGDTVTIAGVTFKFVDTVGSDAGNVHIGVSVSDSRANLKAAIEGGSGEGTDYVDIDDEDRFILREKRRVSTTDDEAMAVTGFGDIVVSETFTAATNVWSNQEQSAAFMVRGSIDLVTQILEIDSTKKEKGFADLVKSLLGVGTNMFDDGKVLTVHCKIDASQWK